MITHDEAVRDSLTAKIDNELSALAEGGKVKIDEAKKVVFKVLQWCGFTFVGGAADSPLQTGIIDQHRGSPVLLCVTPQGALIRPLAPGDSVNIYDPEAGAERTIKVISDEAGKPRLDVPDGDAVFGLIATAPAYLPGTEHLKLNPATGRIEQLKLKEGKG